MPENSDEFLYFLNNF